MNQVAIRDSLVFVFQPRDKAILALAKSILDGADIRYYANGELVQDLFGWGTIGGFNRVAGPVRIMIRPEDEEVAVQLLKPLADVIPPPVPLILRLIATAYLLLNAYGLVDSAIMAFRLR